MRTLLTRLWFLIVVSLLAIAAGVALTVHTRESLGVAVAGSVLTCLGAVAACRKFLRLGFAETWVSNVPMGGAILPTQEDLDQARQEDLDDRAAILASALVLSGTPMQILGYLLAG